MAIMDIPAEARAAVRARRRKEIDELDYRRELKRLAGLGYTQRQISSWLGLTQPSVQSALRTADAVPMPVEGFSGANPYEICERYAAELIDREQLVDELTRWVYVARATTTGPLDDLIVDVPGSFADVERALRRGLIDEDLFDEVADGVEERMRTA